MGKSFLRYLSLILLFITIAAEEELVAKYDIPDDEAVVFNFGKPVFFNCNISSGPEGTELIWERNKTDVRSIEGMIGRYNITNHNQTFYIYKGEYEDAGSYSCFWKEKDIRKNFNAVAYPYVRLPANTGVVEGEKLSLLCTAYGTDLEIVWIIGNNFTIKESTGRYILKNDNNVQNARLVIENVVLDDRGEYTCNVTNVAHKLKKYQPVSDTTLVRVKGKLAALWPFLGICAEVFILCGIILIYEKRRNKTELDESDTDPNTEQKKKRRSYD